MANLTVGKHVGSDLTGLRQDFERIFNHFFGSHSYPVAAAENYFATVPPIETWIDTDNKEFHVSAPLPGVKPEDLNVSVQGNEVTFSGERAQQKGESGKTYFNREFYFDRFERAVRLPDGVEIDKLTAQFKDGVLEIAAPMASASLPRKIEVKQVQAQQEPGSAKQSAAGQAAGRTK